MVPPGFDPEGWRRFLYFCTIHQPHLESGQIYLVGGIGMALAMTQTPNPPRPWRRFRGDEFDLVARRATAVRPSITGQLTRSLLAHYHFEGPGREPYWQVIAPSLRVRANIFATRHDNPCLTVTWRDHTFVVQTLADQLVSTVEDLHKPFAGLPVPVKQYQDALQLLRIIGYPEAHAAWRVRHPGGNFSAALHQAFQARTSLGRLVKRDPYRRFRFRCPDCWQTADFQPIAAWRSALAWAIRR